MIIAIIPAYNEEKTVGSVVKKAKKYVDEVVVVNDGSKDNTEKNAKKVGAKVLSHKINKGFGAAIRTGINYALKKRADVIIFLDADGQHDPKDIPKFVKAVRSGYDFVLGERDISKYPLIKKIGNFMLTILTNLITGIYIHDTESGYRAFSYSGLKKVYPHLHGKKYEIAAETIFAVSALNLKYANVKVASPVYIYGKGVGVMDGIRNFSYLLRKRKKSLKMYISDFFFVLKMFIRDLLRKF